MDTHEAAEYLGVHPVTIKNWHLKRGLSATKKGHSLLFHKADLDSFTPPHVTRARTKDGQDKHLLAVKLSDGEGKHLAEIARLLGYKTESGASRAIQYGRAKLAKAKRKGRART